MRCPIWIFALAVSYPVTAQQSLLDSAERWTISSASSFAVEGGQPVLHVLGAASLDDYVFTDGTISFDVRLTDRPAFVGIQFRAGERDAEHIYLRPHRSDEWDAVQYQPIMNGSSTWQLHRGDGFTGPVTLPSGEWLAIRLQVQGAVARLFIGDATDPVMRLHLERGITSGTIAFTAGFRGPAPTGAIPGSFRRVSVEKAPRVTMTDPRKGSSGDDSFIREWDVSAPFTPSSLPVTAIPQVSGAWSPVTAEARGLVNLNRYFSRIPGGDRTAVVALATVDANMHTTVPLDFDFSDDVSIFLNDELLFSGTNAWESRYPYYLGALHPDILANRVWLNLREGENRLALVVSEQAFGWGFVAKLGDGSSLQFGNN